MSFILCRRQDKKKQKDKKLFDKKRQGKLYFLFIFREIRAKDTLPQKKRPFALLFVTENIPQGMYNKDKVQRKVKDINMNRTKEEQAQAPLLFPARATRRRGLFFALAEEYRQRGHKSAELLLDLLWALAAVFLAQTHALFGVYPFAVAFLASARRRVLPIFVGAAVGCYFLGGIGPLYLAVYGAVLLLRLLLSYPGRKWFLPSCQRLFGELPALRVLNAGLVGLGMAIYELAVGGIASHTLLFALGAVFLPPLLTFVYIGMAESGVNYRFLLGKEAYIPFDGGYGSVPWLYVQLSAAVLLYSIALSLVRTVFFGVSIGTCFMAVATLFVSRRFGALRGCVLGLAVGFAGQVTFVPAFGILGLLSGILWQFGTPCALAVAVLGASGFGAYAGGVSGFLSVAPEVSMASLLFWPLLHRLHTLPDGPVGVATAQPAKAAGASYGAVGRAERLSQTIASLPERIWSEYSGAQRAKGQDYALFARLFGEAVQVGVKEESENSEAQEKLHARFAEEGIRLGRVRVDGVRHLRISLGELSRQGGEVTPVLIQRLCEDALDMPLCYPRTKEGGIWQLESEERLKVEAGFATQPKSEDEPSGDVIRLFSCQDGYYYALLSDGMGTGEEARVAARTCAGYLCALLDAGVRHGQTIRLLNTLLRTSEEECSTTLDLCEIDLLKGTASFLKSGAAPSFVKRGKSLFRIRSRTVPLGLLVSPDTERVNFDIAPGDMILLLSDGVLPGEEADFIRRVLLEEEEERDPQRLAAKILAAAASQGFAPDDRTVGVIYIRS